MSFSINRDPTEVNALNQNAINMFMGKSKKAILIVGKDGKGREFLEVKSKGLWTWIAVNILRLKSYKLETVTEYIESHQTSLNQLDKDPSDFYKLLNVKIDHYNLNHPEASIKNIAFAKKVQTAASTVPAFQFSSSSVLPSSPFLSSQVQSGTKPKKQMTESESIKENKARLINFYVNQRGRLLDLKDQLKVASPKEKQKIQQAISKIEHADIQRAKIALKIQLGNAAEPSSKELADYLGRSTASVRGFLLGQAYSQIVLKSTSVIINELVSIEAKKFGEYGDIVSELKKLGKNANLDQIAQQLKTNKQEAADLMTSLWTMAQEIEGSHTSQLQKLEKTIDQDVANTLGIDPHEIDQWLKDIELEKRLGIELTRLGEEKKVTDSTNKGVADSLVDFLSSASSMDKFLNEMKANQHLFNQPFHLIKLQNILNKLNKDPNLSTQVQGWKKDIQDLMKNISSNMQLSRQSAITKLLENWEEMGDVRSAVGKTFYKELDKNLEELDSSKGIIKGKLEYLNRKAEERINVLEAFLRPEVETPSYKEVIQAIPNSFLPIFLQAATWKNQKATKEKLIDQMLEKIKKKAEEKIIPLPDSDLEKMKKTLEDRASLKVVENKFVLMGLRLHGSSFVDTPYSILSLSYLFPTPKPRYLEQLFEDFSDNDISYTPLTNDNSDLRAGIELTLSKLKNVQARQQERLKALEKGEAVTIPQYFHATHEGAASSIAKTGLEAVHAMAGFGAFFSTELEFRFGYLVFGLPKTIEFSSKAVTILDSNVAPGEIQSEQKVWAGLKDLISINPRVIILQRNFSLAIRQAISLRSKELKDVSDEKKIELEERILQGFNRSVVFRVETSNEGKHVGWSLNYRSLHSQDSLPIGGVHKIQNDEDFNKWATQMIGSAIEQAGMSNKQDQLKQDLLKTLQENFKQAYYYGQELETNYVIKGQATEKLKACVIAPDDELKEMFKKEYKFKTGPDKQIKTLSEVEKQLTEAGLGKDLVEFIPLSEQLIEKDFLMQVDATVPNAWSL